MKDNFESYMQKRFMETHPEVLDDELPDACDDWLASLGADEWLIYGDNFKEQIVNNIVIKIRGDF